MSRFRVGKHIQCPGMNRFRVGKLIQCPGITNTCKYPFTDPCVGHIPVRHWFEQRTFYIGSLRVKFIVAPIEFGKMSLILHAKHAPKAYQT